MATFRPVFWSFHRTAHQRLFDASNAITRYVA